MDVLRLPVLAGLVLSLSIPVHADWPQWRGPTRDGVAKGTSWPAELSLDRLTKTWSVPLAPSYSGPIVSRDRVFVTETVDEATERVRALDRSTGDEIWRAEWPGAMKVPFFAASNGSWIRSTPALDGKRLYVAGMRDVLVCLDAGSGKEIWRRDFTQELGTPVPSFGFVASPLVVDDAVYVQAGGAFLKLDKLSGELIWSSLRDGGGMSGGAFSSPILANPNGKSQLIVQTRQRLAGIDADSGRELWSQDVPAFRGMNILTPTVINGTVFTSTYGGGSFLFDVSDSVPREIWKAKAQGYMSSPVVVGNHVYMHLRNRRFTCISLATGESKWTTTPFGKYWSTVFQGDRILALDERGDLMLIRANPDRFELLGKVHVSDESTWAHVAVSDGEVFVRGLNSQAAYAWR